MCRSIDRLLELAGQPLCARISTAAMSSHPGLSDLLGKVNGFYAFEGALHVYPLSDPGGDTIDAIEWNRHDVWRYEFDGMTDGLFFFAEDIFGCQFALKTNGDVVSFDPESAETLFLANGVDSWAQVLVDDFEVQTGYPLAHEWQLANGPVPLGSRLAPIVPFVLGGEFEVKNLRAVEAIEGMRLRGRLARQIRGLPDGTSVNVRFVKDDRGG